MSLTADSIKLISNDDLFKKLKELGLDKGPVTATTRSIYEKKLINFLDNPNSVQLNQSTTTTSTKTTSPKKVQNSTTDQDDIIILKTTKTQTSTVTTNTADNDDDNDSLNRSTKVPFEFKLLKDTPQSPPVSHSSIYRERITTSGGSPTLRMRQATTTTTSCGYSSMNDSMRQKQDAGAGATNSGESSKNGFNWRLYSYIGFILFIIYLIYLYIQSTNPKNPLVAAPDEQA